MRRASFRAIATSRSGRRSARSLATTFITLLPVASLLRLRRRHAEGLRVRAARRHRLRRVLVDLRRGAAARRAQGARAGVRAPPRRPRCPRRASRRWAATLATEAEEIAAQSRTTPAAGADVAERGSGRLSACRRRRRFDAVVEARAPPPAARIEAPWPIPLATGARSRHSPSPGSAPSRSPQSAPTISPTSSARRLGVERDEVRSRHRRRSRELAPGGRPARREHRKHCRARRSRARASLRARRSTSSSSASRSSSTGCGCSSSADS